MPNSSRFKAIETVMKTTIAAQANIIADGVGVSRGHPGKALTDEHVWIGDMRFGEEAAALSPASPRRQNITWDVLVRVSQRGNDVAGVRDRVYLIGDYVEKALHAEMSLGGEANFGSVTGGGLETWMESESWVAALLLEATYVARRD